MNMNTNFPGILKPSSWRLKIYLHIWSLLWCLTDSFAVNKLPPLERCTIKPGYFSINPKKRYGKQLVVCLHYINRVLPRRHVRIVGIGVALKWATKVLRHLAVKFDFLASWKHPLANKQCGFFLFVRQHNHSVYPTLNWGAGDIRKLALEANKIA